VLADGTALPSDITVWAAGVAAPHAVSGWGLPQAADGRIRTGPDLRVAGQDRIFAVGDIAVIDSQPLPQLAQPALRMGRHAADQTRRLEASQPPVPSRYHDKGIMATTGYRSAVVQLPRRIRIRGTPAWLAWLALHLITLLGGRNRISALVNLSWRYLTWRRGRRRHHRRRPARRARAAEQTCRPASDRRREHRPRPQPHRTTTQALARSS